ncbi:MAG TPA: hypothetical protein VFX22_01790 [Candidatus Kapabacteria bacterium]|nr:hypothetical protein [Candidatus Kapabacteria bacterium]
MTVTVVDPNGDTTQTYPLSYSVEASCSGAFTMKYLEEAACPYWNTPMSIDTIGHIIRGLSFYHNIDNVGESGGLCVQFGPIPYKDSAGFLKAGGKFSANYDLWEEYSSGMKYWARGGCGAIGTLTDSVNIEIQPVNSSVTQAKNVPVSNQLVVEISEGKIIILSQVIPFAINRFEVMDMLGRTIILQNLKPDEKELNISFLPPGCYFARLGDQVAKFVVPPR